MTLKQYSKQMKTGYLNHVVSRLEDFAIVINADVDQVAVAKKDIPVDFLLEYRSEKIKIKDLIQKGQRFALRDMEKGEFIRQYGHVFGQSKGILKGELISIANIQNILPEVRTGEHGKQGETEFKEEYLNRTFSGYGRKNGKVGTRNYYLIVPT